MMTNPYERTGDKFDFKKYLRARELCIQAVHEIKSEICPGQTEKEIKNNLEERLRSFGASKFWHPTKVRLGPDTTKSFRELPDETLMSEQNELCFLDVGPVFDEHEADYGETFVIGNKTKHPLVEASFMVFEKVKKAWQGEKLTGLELLSRASFEAEKLGYYLNPLMDGHRLGDFPHHLFFKGGLFEFEHQPVPHLWILEIHLIDKQQGRGAFFEDLL